MLMKQGNFLVPVGIAGLIGAQLIKYTLGLSVPAVLVLAASFGCLLLGVRQSSPGRGRFAASRKRLIQGGLEEKKRRTWN